ncbi:hypothetical protein NDU88_002627 [Pleurodeles waltl]|uniref:Uncharacterized protein n=1 Tax=Pleurodeles waltl TaxID=8319 RepID=A0AAV7W2X4_PLEWA|nr:hypothetical protein NDU88_002627 [Pleurodeles waltl]
MLPGRRTTPEIRVLVLCQTPSTRRHAAHPRDQNSRWFPQEKKYRIKKTFPNRNFAPTDMPTYTPETAVPQIARLTIRVCHRGAMRFPAQLGIVR